MGKESMMAVLILAAGAGVLARFAPATPVVRASMDTCLRQRPSTDPLIRHHYHKEPSAGPLPSTLDPAEFATKNKKAFVAYSLAARVKELLYQQPCYCTCDKGLGHESLLDCYTARHGAACMICEKEVIITYEQSRAGKTAAEIRQAMDQGEVWKFDLDEYVEEHYARILRGPQQKE